MVGTSVWWLLRCLAIEAHLVQLLSHLLCYWGRVLHFLHLSLLLLKLNITVDYWLCVLEEVIADRCDCPRLLRILPQRRLKTTHYTIIDQHVKSLTLLVVIVGEPLDVRLYEPNGISFQSALVHILRLLLR